MITVVGPDTARTAHPIPAGGTDLRISASIGVATGAAAQVDTLVRQADAAMYEAKCTGTSGHRART